MNDIFADDSIALAMCTAMLAESTPVDVVANDALLERLLYEISKDYELGWSPLIIARSMELARQLFLTEMERIDEEAEFDGVIEPDEYHSERLGK